VLLPGLGFAGDSEARDSPGTATMSADGVQVRATFETAAPLFRHALKSELESEGLEVVPGPAPLERRGGPAEAIELLRVSLEVLGGARVLEGTVESVAKIVRAIHRAVGERPTMPETVLTIYGPDGKPLKELRVPAKREGWSD
jgi:hypothetical protein